MIVTTLEQLNEFYEKAKQERTLIWDIESSGLVYYDKAVERFGLEDWETLPHGDKIIGHAFLLPSTKETFYIPVRHLVSCNCDLNAVNPKLFFLFGNNELTLVAHNQKFDVKFAKKEDIAINATQRCTLLMAHAANENEESLGLKQLGVKYVNHDADAEKIALESAQEEWVKGIIAPIEAKIVELETSMKLMERDWKNKKKADLKVALAESRKKLSGVKKCIKENPDVNYDIMLSDYSEQIETLRGQIQDINARNPNQHLNELPLEFLQHKAHREDLMERIARIKRIKPIENLRNLPLELVAEYAEQDCCLTYALYQRLERQLEEQKLLDVALHPKTGICRYGVAIGKMEEHGLLMDRDFIHKAIENCNAKQEELRAQAFSHVGEEFNLDSHHHVKRVTGLASSAREFLEVSEHPVAQLVNEYRQWGRAKGTYFEVFLEYLDANDRLHPELLLQTVAGRASMKRPSMNTLPRESDIYNVRGSIIASPGYILADIDYSQLELRLLAHFSSDPNLLHAYQNGIDVHQQTADMIGVSRQVAKRVNFSVVYGAGPAGLIHSLRMERQYLYKLVEDMGSEAMNRGYVTGAKMFQQENGLKWDLATPQQKQDYLELGTARNILDDYKRRFPLVDAYIKRVIEFAKRHRYTEMFTGRRRRYPDLKSADGRTYNLARTAPNNMIQGSGSELLRLAITNIDRKLDLVEEPKPRLLLQVHDSLLAELKNDDKRDFYIEHIIKEMENVARFKVPIVVEAKIGFRWNELKTYERKS